ncbi:MAG: hypothetical protein V1686_02545 [Patescibacteria group bacterium]
MTIHEFIKKRPHLVWYTQNYDKLSTSSILEHVLNYGDWNDIQELFTIINKKEAAKIFLKQIQQKRCNYRPEIKNYFNLYFKQYA